MASEALKAEAALNDWKESDEGKAEAARKEAGWRGRGGVGDSFKKANRAKAKALKNASEKAFENMRAIGKHDKAARKEAGRLGGAKKAGRLDIRDG